VRAAAGAARTAPSAGRAWCGAGATRGPGTTLRGGANDGAGK